MCLLWLEGRRNVLRTEPNDEDAIQDKVSSRNKTKENTPSINKTKAQPVAQSLQSPSRPRAPLAESNNMLIPEASDANTVNTANTANTASADSKFKKAPPLPAEVKCESKEQKASACPEMGEKSAAAETKQSKAGGAKEHKAPAAKNRSRAGHKKTENKAPQNKKVTDYFPVRKSNRKTKTELKSEQHKHLDDLIRNGVEQGMEVKQIEGKGRGVFAVNGFKKGDFVVEYFGDLLELSEAKVREAEYALDPSAGCYMYYFQYQTKTYCVDATRESERLGRLLNHSKSGNCQTRLHPIDGTPHLILVASRDIAADEELLYDYGDRSKASISAHPWLKH